MTQLLRHADTPRQRSGYQDYRLLPPPLAAALRQARLQARMTVREAAARAGISAPFMSRLERGERCPRPDVARRLAAALWLDDRLAQTLIDHAADEPERRWT